MFFLFNVTPCISDITGAFGEIVTNSWPCCWNSFSFCHWNLNANNFIIMSQLEDCNSIHKFDIIYLLGNYFGNYCQSGKVTIIN